MYDVHVHACLLQKLYTGAVIFLEVQNSYLEATITNAPIYGANTTCNPVWCACVNSFYRHSWRSFSPLHYTSTVEADRHCLGQLARQYNICKTIRTCAECAASCGQCRAARRGSGDAWTHLAAQQRVHTQRRAQPAAPRRSSPLWAALARSWPCSPC